MPPLTLHEYAASGNCYKIRLVAAHLGVPLARRQYDILAGETRTPAFLSGINAAGQIPVLQVGDDFLPESGAACLFLAEGSPLMPDERWQRAQMLRWMFWEQYRHEPNIATLRFWRAFVGEDRLSPEQRAAIAAKEEAGRAALAIIDTHLATRSWMVADRLTLADVVLYAYTHVAGEGGFDLALYPAVQRWCARVAALPGHVPLDA